MCVCKFYGGYYYYYIADQTSICRVLCLGYWVEYLAARRSSPHSLTAEIYLTTILAVMDAALFI